MTCMNQSVWQVAEIYYFDEPKHESEEKRKNRKQQDGQYCKIRHENIMNLWAKFKSWYSLGFIWNTIQEWILEIPKLCSILQSTSSKFSYTVIFQILLTLQNNLSNIFWSRTFVFPH